VEENQDGIRMSASMEDIISALLLPDSSAITAATEQLGKRMKSGADAAVAELCSVMTTSPAAERRQYAAVILRKRFGRSNTWHKLSGESRAVFKAGCLKAHVDEQEKSVRFGIAQLIAVVAKHEFKNPGGGWTELIAFLNTSLSSADPAQRLLAMYAMSVLCETCAETMKPVFTEFFSIFHRSIADDTCLEVGFYAVRSITHLVVHAGSDQLHAFQNLVPPVIGLVERLLAAGQEEQAREAMDLFDELFESELAIVVPHIKPIVSLSLKISAEASLEEATRVKAIAFLGRITRLKKKTIVRFKLYVDMVNVLFPIMSHMEDGEEDGDDEDDLESGSPSVAACQALDSLAVNLPPEKYMPALLSHVQPALQGSDPGKMKAAFNALAVSAEGCSEYIRTKKYLSSFLQVIGTGINSPHRSVRNAALYAVGQFSEYLQPEISGYANEILPVLFHYVDSALTEMAEGKDSSSSGLDRIFYALEIFSENLEEKLVPFVGEVMKRLLLILNSNAPANVKEMAVSAIGSTANAVGPAIFPYFDEVMGHLKNYLALNITHEDSIDTQSLLVQSMDTLGFLVVAVGPTNLAPTLAEDSCQLGLDLVTKHDDPDVRKGAYSLFSHIASAVKDKMGAALPKIVELMLRSLASKEGISIEYNDDDGTNPVLDLNASLSTEEAENGDAISIGTEDSTDHENIKAINVENSFMDEKKAAVYALKEICKHTGPAFLPFLYQSLDESWKLLEFPEDEVRKSSVEAVTEFTVAYYVDGSLGTRPSSVEACQKSLSALIPRLCQMVQDDQETEVVCVALENLARLLKDCGPVAIAAVPNCPEMVVACVRLVMSSKCACMDKDEFEGDDDVDDEQEAEQDELLFQCAGEVLPALGIALASPEAFSPYFAGLFSNLLKKTKKTCTPAERSFSVGTLAECVEPLAGVLAPFATKLYQTFVSSMKDDSDDDVRNNAVFGLGELAMHGGEQMQQNYPQILHNLSNLVGHEESPKVVDQVVGAVCRMIVARPDLVPIAEVLPVVFAQLPLKEDHEEYPIVYRCLLDLYAKGEPMLKANMAKILATSGEIYGTDKCGAESKKTEELLVALVRAFYTDMRGEFEAAVAQFPPETAQRLAQIVGSAV
jgi:hypothetical protein